MTRTVAFIPVRGGSTSIPLKNIRPLLGKPLVYWTAAAASAVPAIDEVFVSTDSEAIVRAVEALGLPKVRVIGRSPETATSTASSESALLEFAENHEFDQVVFIQATSPLLEASDIERGLELMAQPDCDSVISVVEDKHFYWSKGEGGRTQPVNYDVFARPRRQDFEGWYQENGAFYITERERLLSSRNRVSGTIRLLAMSEDSLFEIDEPEDWLIIESLLQKKLRAAHELKYGKPDIRIFLTDCDGCLTDAGMYYDGAGNEMKKFNTRDGMAFGLLHAAGIKCGIITGENSSAAKQRAAKLKLEFLELGCQDKLAAVSAICQAEGVTLSQVAYVGDDLNDLELLQAVGMSFTPADACRQARGVAQYVTEAKGGAGVIREAAELVLGT